MPYPRSLHRFTQPDFYAEVPPSWESRLREVSPITANLDHLRLRYMAPHGSWLHPERGQWILYSCKPIALVDKDRALQFREHWSELPSEFQVGRQGVVSDYQHFMWHAQGLYVRPFLILQGEWGGTPAKYTPQEVAFLESSLCFSEPFPIGFFPACPFDERTVKTIALRDRLLQQSNSYGALEHLDSPESLKAEDEAAMLVRRQTYLDTWNVMMQPSVEFYQSFVKKKAAQMALPDAPEDLGNRVGQWKEHYLEHGHVVGVTPATQKRLLVPVS